MYFEFDTPRGKLRNSIIENATEDQLTVIPANFFGDIYIFGEEHKKAAEYFKKKIKDCKTKGDEIKLHFEIEEKFNIGLYNKQG